MRCQEKIDVGIVFLVVESRLVFDQKLWLQEGKVIGVPADKPIAVSVYAHFVPRNIRDI